MGYAILIFNSKFGDPPNKITTPPPSPQQYNLPTKIKISDPSPQQRLF